MRVAFKQLHKRVEEQFSQPENEVSVGRRQGKAYSASARRTCLMGRGTSGCLTSPLTRVRLAGRQVSGHQRLLFPALLRARHPHAKAFPASGSARRHADQQDAAASGQGGLILWSPSR